MNLKQLFIALGCQLATLLVATSAEALPESPEVSRAPPPADAPDAEIDWNAPSPNQPAVRREPPAQAVAKPISTAVTTPPSCDVGVFDDVPDNCSTPRTGTVSNWHAALDIGMATLSQGAAHRIGVGPGPAIDLRLGMGIRDTVVTNTTIGFMTPSDRRPIAEMVTQCEANTSFCGPPESQQSGVAGGFWGLEVGVQHRFRPWTTTSWTPGLMLGYNVALGHFQRRVVCDGCNSVALDADPSGGYVAPFFRVTFGRMGIIALLVRSEWFLNGDLQQFTTLGVEFGLP